MVGVDRNSGFAVLAANRIVVFVDHFAIWASQSFFASFLEASWARQCCAFRRRTMDFNDGSEAAMGEATPEPNKPIPGNMFK